MNPLFTLGKEFRFHDSSRLEMQIWMSATTRWSATMRHIPSSWESHARGKQICWLSSLPAYCPEVTELVVVSQPVAQAFCGRLLLQHLQHATYFDPGTDWPKPIELNATFPIVLEQLAFLGDTRSRRELLVFAQANPSRLSLTMESSSQRYLSGEWPASATQSSMTRWSVFFAVSWHRATVTLPDSHDLYLPDNLLALAGHGDGHVLTHSGTIIGHPHWTIRPVHCRSFWSWQNALRY